MVRRRKASREQTSECNWRDAAALVLDADLAIALRAELVHQVGHRSTLRSRISEIVR